MTWACCGEGPAGRAVVRAQQDRLLSSLCALPPATLLIAIPCKGLHMAPVPAAASGADSWPLLSSLHCHRYADVSTADGRLRQLIMTPTRLK